MAKPSVSKASTHWEGNLFQGKGRTKLETSGLDTFDVNWGKRAEAGLGTTNPEELLAAAYSACFSMALSNGLAEAGHDPASLDTTAEVTFVPGTGITGIKLIVRGDVPGLDAAGFKEKVEWAKENCPVGQALKVVPKEFEIV